MAVWDCKDSFHGKFSASAGSKHPVETSRDKVSKFKFGKLHEYLLHNNVCYEDMSVVLGKGGSAEGGKKSYPESALRVWETIAVEMTKRFFQDRAGQAKPKWKNAKGPAGQQPIVKNPVAPVVNQAPVLDQKPKWKKDTKKLIVNWFKKNYDEACAAGKKASTRPYKTQPTKPANAIAKQVQDSFNTFYNGKQFGAAGVTLPAIVLNKMKNRPFPEYMPYCKPHKDAPGNVEITEGNKKIRKGAPGYVVGPFLTNRQFVETGDTVEIDDNTNKEEVGVVKEDASNLDKNEFLIDDAFYNSQVKAALGASYQSFRKRVNELTGAEGEEFSGIPIDGKEITIPPETEGGQPKSLNPKVFNIDRTGNGLQNRPTAGGLINPNFNKPIVDPAYGGAEFDTDLKVRLWKNNNDAYIVFSPGSDKGAVWSGNQSSAGSRYGDGKESVECYMKFEKTEKNPGSSDARSFSDPRTWGPWNEYEGFGVDDSEDDKEVIKMGLHKLRYKYIIPTGLVTAINSADTTKPHKPINGLPGFKGPGLPAMNKQYWGLRIVEAFPNATSLEDAIEKATSPPPKDDSGNPVIVPGAGGILDKGGTTFVGGPAPPLMVKAKKVKFGQGKWKWSNKELLMKKGVVDRGDGKPFSGKVKTQGIGKLRNRKLTKPSIKHSKSFCTNNATVKKLIDEKINGKGQGGMTWFDASKQIIPPYAPPPLKPPLPNTKKFEF